MTLFNPNDVPTEDSPAYKKPSPFEAIPHADAKTIGSIVKIQIFERVEYDGDELVYESMLMTIGKLIFLQVDKDDFAFAMEGIEGVRGINRHTHRVEIYPHDPEYA